MKFIGTLGIFLALVFTHANAKSIENDAQEWEKFKTDYNRTYSSDSEENHRKEIFFSNTKFIAEHNEKNKFKLKMNQFGDLSHEEFKKYMTDTPTESTSKYYLNENSADETLFTLDSQEDQPKKVDLRKTGFVSEVKDQGKFNKSSWAFAVNDALEGQLFKHCSPVSISELSEQFLIDCKQCDDEPEKTCGFDSAFLFTKKTGVVARKLYTYLQQGHSTCPKEDVLESIKIHLENVWISSTSFKGIKKLLSSSQDGTPVPAYVDASHQSFQFYHEGIYTEPKCATENTNLNHAVLIVGYDDTSEETGHWIVKNSWGKSWGKDGYMKIAYATCGIEKKASKVFVTINDCECKKLK